MTPKPPRPKSPSLDVQTVSLPSCALTFLDEKRSEPSWRSRVVRWFHAFCEQRQVDLACLTTSHIDELLDLLAKKSIMPSTCQMYRYYLYVYLDWLFAHAVIGFDPKSVRRTQTFPKAIPDEANRFLNALTTLKPSSITFYRTTLRSFYTWLVETKKDLGTLTHWELTDWFNHNKRRGLKAATQVHLLAALRVYFNGCYEQNLIETDPDELIRPNDFPPVPTYLPRPLPIDADIQLQRRFEKSEDLTIMGLWLMRNTGLRIGELISLDWDCIRTDLNNRHFLKVPLGKLNNERLVPLDDKTHQLVLRLQERSLTPGEPVRTRLLERVPGKPTNYDHYKSALLRICKGLQIPNKMTTHRLRHTYATTLLNAGMSLIGVMHLLGHRYIRTTLRYAAVTQETVVKEYFLAISNLETTYASASLKTNPSSAAISPTKMLTDVAKWLGKYYVDGKRKQSSVPALIKRIHTLQTQIEIILSDDKGR